MGSFAGSFFALLYYLPIYFQSVDGVSASESGIRNIPLILALCTFCTISTPFSSTANASSYLYHTIRWTHHRLWHLCPISVGRICSGYHRSRPYLHARYRLPVLTLDWLSGVSRDRHWPVDPSTHYCQSSLRQHVRAIFHHRHHAM